LHAAWLNGSVATARPADSEASQPRYGLGGSCRRLRILSSRRIGRVQGLGRRTGLSGSFVLHAGVRPRKACRTLRDVRRADRFAPTVHVLHDSAPVPPDGAGFGHGPFTPPSRGGDRRRRPPVAPTCPPRLRSGRLADRAAGPCGGTGRSRIVSLSVQQPMTLTSPCTGALSAHCRRS
jgi:hypothetical protein